MNGLNSITYLVYEGKLSFNRTALQFVLEDGRVLSGKIITFPIRVLKDIDEINFPPAIYTLPELNYVVEAER